ncbi:MAG TPA: YcnI family protein [Nocardioides sp.]|uniref:YcnI family protein n=1 Tax=Nocardioides sp. TaxID=35761 RepID=UPI002E32676E|nr:YcnI family protein [Nocardioides sp.]HEX3931360.1 YcnI family protein [Nocardioides sp.]
MRTVTARVTAGLALAALAALAVLLAAGPASAHVTVDAPGATRGGYAVLTFRVPDETDNADTTKVQVFFPPSQPLASVSVRPTPGWSFRVHTTKLDKPISSDDGQVTQAVSEVTWTADSRRTSVKPGEFEEFAISVGPLPQAPTMVFKALQTYSDGTVVRWIDLTPPGGPEPEHPAPTLTLAAATTGSSSPASVEGHTSGGSGRATAALVLSVVALLVALAAGAAALLRLGGDGSSR